MPNIKVLVPASGVFFSPNNFLGQAYNVPMATKTAYLDLHETPIPRLAREAADAFARGEPLNATIEKMAVDQGLAPNQVHFLCAEANKRAFLDTFEQRGYRGDFEFDIARPEQILGRLNGPAHPVQLEPEKQASVKTARVRREAEVFRTPESELQDAKLVWERSTLTKFAAQDDLAAARRDLEDCTRAYVAEMRRAVLLKEASLQELSDLLVQARPQHGAGIRKLCADVASEVGPEWTKRASAPVEEGLFDRLLTISGEPVLVINGGAKFVQDLDRIVDKLERVHRFDSAYIGAVEAEATSSAGFKRILDGNRIKAMEPIS